MNWLACGADEIGIPLGRELSIRVPKFPVVFQSPVSYRDPAAAQEVQSVDEYGPEGREGGDAT